MSVQTIFSFITLLGHVALVAGFIGFVVSKTFRTKLENFSEKFAYIIGFFIAIFSMAGSLYFSDILGWEPCVLCWYQRIAMYPLVVIFSLGVWKQDISARMYGLALSFIGLSVALYQVYLQISAASGSGLSVFCSTIGGADCSEIFMLEFGYITFPVMSATAFLFIVVLLLLKRTSTY